MTTAAPASSDSCAALFEESLLRQEMRSGELITAEVVSVDNDIVIVNARLKSEKAVWALSPDVLVITYQVRTLDRMDFRRFGTH